MWVWGETIDGCWEGVSGVSGDFYGGRLVIEKIRW